MFVDVLALCSVPTSFLISFIICIIPDIVLPLLNRPFRLPGFLHENKVLSLLTTLKVYEVEHMRNMLHRLEWFGRRKQKKNPLHANTMSGLKRCLSLVRICNRTIRDSRKSALCEPLNNAHWYSTFFSSSFSLLLQTHFNVPCLVLHNSLILERGTEFRDKKIIISKEAN